MYAIITTPNPKGKNKIVSGNIVFNGFSKITIVTCSGKMKSFNKPKHIIQIVQETVVTK